LDEYAVSVFRNKIIGLEMWPGSLDEVPRNVVNQDLIMGREEKPCPSQQGTT
jgi:hypothetical protein